MALLPSPLKSKGMGKGGKGALSIDLPGDLRVHLAAHDDGEGGEIEPDQEHDDGAEGAVGPRVRLEVVEIGAEAEGGAQEEDDVGQEAEVDW
jgi:hypothetical protein